MPRSSHLGLRRRQEGDGASSLPSMASVLRSWPGWPVPSGHGSRPQPPALNAHTDLPCFNLALPPPNLCLCCVPTQPPPPARLLSLWASTEHLFQETSSDLSAGVTLPSPGFPRHLPWPRVSPECVLGGRLGAERARVQAKFLSSPGYGGPDPPLCTPQSPQGGFSGSSGWYSS